MKKHLLIAFLLFSLKGFGQDSSSVSNSQLIDKLTNHISSANFTASVVPKKILQLDLDLVYIKGKQGEYYKFKDQSWPEIKLRYGLFKNMELRLGTRIGYTYSSFNAIKLLANNYDPLLTGPMEHRKLFSDYLTLGLKANLINYKQNKGSLAILAESYLPILKSAKVRSPSFPPTLTLISSNQLNRWLNLNLNAGASTHLHNTNSSSPLIDSFHFSVTPVATLTKPLKLFMGLNGGFFINHEIYQSFTYYAGILYAPLSDLQLRAAFSWENNQKIRLNSYHFNLGLAWRLNYFEIN